MSAKNFQDPSFVQRITSFLLPYFNPNQGARRVLEHLRPSFQDKEDAELLEAEILLRVKLFYFAKYPPDSPIFPPQFHSSVPSPLAGFWADKKFPSKLSRNPGRPRSGPLRNLTLKDPRTLGRACRSCPSPRAFPSPHRKTPKWRRSDRPSCWRPGSFSTQSTPWIFPKSNNLTFLISHPPFLILTTRTLEYLDVREYHYWKKCDNKPLENEEQVRQAIESGKFS